MTWDGFENSSNMFDYDPDDTVVNLIYFSLAIYIPILISENSIVIATFVLMKCLHTPDNQVIAWLSMADLMQGLVGIPITILQAWDQEMFQGSYGMCVMDTPIRLTIHSFTLSMLMLLTIDRCISIAYPFWYNSKVTNFEVNLSAVCLVTLDIIIYIIILSYAMLSNSKVKGNIINCTLRNLPKWFKYVITLVAMLKIVISLLCTITVTIVLRNSFRKLKNIQYGFGREKYNSMKKDQKIIVILLFMFFILWTPSLAVPYMSSEDNLRVFGMYTGIVLHMTSLNSCLNCIVYAFSRRVYREALVFIVTHRPCHWNKMKMELRMQSSKRLTVTTTPKDSCLSRQTNISQLDKDQIIGSEDQKTSSISHIEQETPSISATKH